MLLANSDSPYYSLSTFTLYVPLAIIYSFAANLYVRFVAPHSVLSDSNNTLVPIPVVQQQQQEPTRIAIVTGSNTGIGFETAQALALDHGYTVILACRSRSKGEAAVARIQQQQKQQENNFCKGQALFLQPLDLSSLDSVRSFCQALEWSSSSSGVLSSSDDRKIHVLINNAGRNTSEDKPTPDGLNSLFQSNFVGHYVLTRELLDRKLLAPQARIVNLSSVMHHFCGNADAAKNIESPEFWKQTATQKSDGMTYSLSKLAAILFTIELNRRYGDQIQAVAVNPGSVNSDIWRDMPRFMVSIFRIVYLNNRQGCHTSVTAAVIPSIPRRGEQLTPYIQPYWLPSWSIDTNSYAKGSGGGGTGTHWPVPEMLGPYSPRWATPRLPVVDGGRAAAGALWHACEEITQAAM